MTTTNGKIVVIDDDLEMRSLLCDFLVSEGYSVDTYSLASLALKEFMEGGRYFQSSQSNAVDVVISDLKMAQMDGMEFLSKLKAIQPDLPVVLITAFGTIDTAIEAMRRGALNYVVKPFKLADMSVIVQKAVEQGRLVNENHILRHEIKKSWRLGDVVGKSSKMREIFDLVARVSQSTANILITGESGTGKEMIARAIHESGPRSSKPFVPINCTAIPEQLLESELFGHAKGSFTGATTRKKGLFEEAHGGTLFLDEIGDMSGQLQAKLLRVIQDRKIRSVGDIQLYDVDVRIIAATHKDLRKGIKDGNFREDLFYRLSVIPIVIPPLRDRPEDIPFLADYFLAKYAASNHSNVRGFTKRAISKLMRLRWEGNVRELENVIERAVVLSSDTWVDEKEIPDPEMASPNDFFKNATGDFPSLDRLEERYIRMVLEKVAGRKEKAAQILGINRRTLYRKEQQYGFSVDEPGSDAEVTH